MGHSLLVGAHSEVGRVRKNNQDAGYASPRMLLVADGMGGAAAGDLASAVAVTVAADADQSLRGEEMLSHMEGVISSANSRLSQLVSQDLSLDGMGTTFCGAMFDGDQFAITHVGDSRCYLLRDGELTQLTHDHSWVQQLIDEGRLTPKQAETHPHRSLIVRVLNGQEGVRPDLELVDAALGDRIMFCSDGLSGLVSDDHIRKVLAERDLDVAIKDLAAAANHAGGHDNITIVMADVVEHDDALDAVTPLIVGSILERSIPEPPGVTPPSGAALPETSPDHAGEEVARYAPEVTSRRWPGVVGGALALLLILGGGIWGVVAYGTSRYYLAEASGNVAIYNGLPGSLLGVELNTLTEVTDIPIGDLPRFYQRAVGNTIATSGLTGAHDSVEELRWKAERCVEVREERAAPEESPLPSPTMSPSGLSTQAPSYPTFLAPITPTASAETDPEEC
ncbi:MAG: PP2C family protein-serine/threonine phosphatase [Arachnia sp.]